MEKGLKAFFYEYKYYLLPEGCYDVDDLKREKVWEVKRLKEELCMAPNFVYESMETELLTIEHPERVFPAEVDLYNREEYDKLLWEQVKCVCSTCANYVDNGDGSLDGHHREISLDGACYIKQREEERWSFAFCAETIFDSIGAEGERLLKYIEKNKQDSIYKLVSERLGKFFLPNTVYGGYDEEGPCLAFYANDYAAYPGIRLILKMLADTANKESCWLSEYVKVYPYLPKGMLPTVKRPDYVKSPPRLFMKIDEQENICLGLYEPKLATAKEAYALKIANAAYQYLCYRMGENVLLGGCAAYSVLETLPTDMQEVTAEELEALLLKRAKPEESIPEPFFPPPYFREAYEEEPEMLPHKESLTFAMTVCPELSPEKSNEDTEGGNTVYEGFNIVYAYLYIPKERSDFDFDSRMNTLVWYLQNLEQYPEPIGDGDGALSVFMKKAGTVITEHGVCEDLMIFDEKAFFRWMRHLTPVLKGLNVKLVTVKRDGVVVYEPDYRIVAEGSDWLN